ncbi:MAG: DMT family transporter [Clostridia bacterium]|nr:DMT family transporter [Clostridia bacterium]
MDLRHRCMLQMLLCALLWSLGGLFIKLSPWHGLVLAGGRSLLAALVLAAYLIARRRPFLLNRRTLGVAVTLSGTFFSCVMATKLTTAANAIVLQYSVPVFILLYGTLFQRKRFRLADWLVVPVTLGGVALFFFDQLDGGRLLGNLIGLLAALFFTGCFLTSEAAGEDERMNGIFQGQLLTALIGLPFAFVFGMELSLPAIGGAAVLGILQIGLPYILYALALRGCPPLACSLLAVIEPLLNPVWVALFYGETPGPFALAGGLVVIAAVTLWCVYNERREAAAKAGGAP